MNTHHQTKQLFIAFFAIFSFSFFALDINAQEDTALSNESIAEISERLESYSENQLIERRNFLINYLEENEDEAESDETSVRRTNALLELSVIEQLLILAGVVMLDNINEDSSTPPDTVSPVLTVLGANPATVELGATYTDAGATSDGGETVSSSGTVDTNTVGSYTITYSATDAAGNTGTATRTVNGCLLYTSDAADE